MSQSLPQLLPRLAGRLVDDGVASPAPGSAVSPTGLEHLLVRAREDHERHELAELGAHIFKGVLLEDAGVGEVAGRGVHAKRSPQNLLENGLGAWLSRRERASRSQEGSNSHHLGPWRRTYATSRFADGPHENSLDAQDGAVSLVTRTEKLGVPVREELQGGY